MALSILAAIAGFGAIVVSFLWIRDVRILLATRKGGYRRAAYRGVLYTALGWAGTAIAYAGSDFLGLALVLIALYLQGKIDRERVWKGETAIERFFGAVRQSNDKESGENQ